MDYTFHSPIIDDYIITHYILAIHKYTLYDCYVTLKYW
jgi:hypothetical protein